MAKPSPSSTPSDQFPRLSSRRNQRSITTIAAYIVVVLGLILIFISGFYVYSRSRSGSDAADFAYSISDNALGDHLGRSAPAVVNGSIDGETPIPLELKAPDVAQFASLYPGDRLNPKYWSEPEWAGSDPFGGPTIPDDFISVLSTDLVRDFDPNAEAVRIRIPSINVDSTVVELRVIDLGDQRSYETPNNTVGHIPETSLPGQQGSGWFFAHLESFVAQEGNIFRHLPEISELMKQDPVDVYLVTPDSEYIYRVTGTNQIHQDDLELTNSDDAQITLVTCWPPRVYDQRVLVDAILIAYRPI